MLWGISGFSWRFSAIWSVGPVDLAKPAIQCLDRLTVIVGGSLSTAVPADTPSAAQNMRTVDRFVKPLPADAAVPSETAVVKSELERGPPNAWAKIDVITLRGADVGSLSSSVGAGAGEEV